MYLGIDIGSASSKAVIVDGGLNIRASCVRDSGIGSDGSETVVAEALGEAGIDRGDVACTVATGYGRLTYGGADMQVAELSCHSKGVYHVMPSARTLIDIGGQDAKIIRLDDKGRIVNFAMNDKCAAGTGRFLELMARVLGVEVDGLMDIAERSMKEVSISNVCAVFAESEVISRLSAGESREDVARGAHASIARRIAGLAARVGVEPLLAMTGGVAKNRDVVAEIGKAIGCEVAVPESPQLMGALGAAIYAAERRA
ncbi:MAG: acyl-CoA dehydratase activase [Clostridiales Family XIII bacterium]|jgi:predicted CoA-substrate-specific enzyme activase|nr:acyl-CoA dehydratase activase [Clostridiales Family XIII bacterium]